jgi:hypothetical protein
MSSYLYRDSRIHLAYKKSLEIPKGLSEAERQPQGKEKLKNNDVQNTEQKTKDPVNTNWTENRE